MGRANLIAVVVFLASLAAVFSMSSKTSQHLQRTVLGWFEPFAKAGAVVEGVVMPVALPPRDPEEIESENERLREENMKLTVYQQQWERINLENEEYRRLFGYRKNSPFALIPTKVVKRTISTWWSSIMLDCGLDQGVTPDAPVLTDKGVVGKTTQVTQNSCIVLLLTDEQCRVAARVEGTTERGILMGHRGDLESSPYLTLRYLSRDAMRRVQVGQLVYSSGDGNLFPAGFLLGEIHSVKKVDLYCEAEVKPSVDFGLLRNVFVMKMQSPVP